MGSPEQAVVDEALERGFISAEQLSEAQRVQQQLASSQTPSKLLPILAARFLSPDQREHLKLVYQHALGDPGAEETRELDVPATLAPPVELKAPGAVVATVAVGSPSSLGLARTKAHDSQLSALEAPKRIGGYEVVGELGRGAMGVVYKARSVSLERDVALKVLLAGDAAGEEQTARFQVEARAAARLRHANIVGVLEQGRDDEGRLYTAMDMIEGEALNVRLARDGPLPPREAARLTCDLARALEYAHSRSVLHRDLKPHNILIDLDGHPLITDFGLAKLVGDKARSLTATGAGAMGTPAYMPPEQAGGEHKTVDGRADVYSLGATLYHMLPGRPPFEGTSAANILIKVLQKEPTPPSAEARVPKALDIICLKCLEKEKVDRYDTAQDLADDLQRFLDDVQILAKPPTPGRRIERWINRHRLLVAIGGVCALLLLVGGVVLAGAMSTAERERESAAEAEEDAERSRRELAKRERDRDAQDLEKERQLAAAREEAERKRKAKEAAERKARDARAELDEKQRELDRLKEEQRRREEERRKAELLATRVDETPPESKTSEPKKTRDPVRKTEDPPKKTEDPPRKTEDPPAKKTRDPAPAKRPSRWRIRRLASAGLQLSYPLWAVSWEEAIEEARERNVPLVVFLCKGKVDKSRIPSEYRRQPKLVEWLNQRAVAVVAQDLDHSQQKPSPSLGLQVDPRVPVEGDPCPFFLNITCKAHNEMKDSVDGRKNGGGIHLERGDNKRKVFIITPAGRVRFSSTKAKKKKLGPNEWNTQRGLPLHLLDQVQSELGKPRSLRQLLYRGHSKLLKADRDLLKGKRSRSLFKTFESSLKKDGLEGEWARFRLEERCKADIAKAKNRSGKRAKRDLRRMKKLYAAHPPSVALIEEALVDVD